MEALQPYYPGSSSSVSVLPCFLCSSSFFLIFRFLAFRASILGPPLAHTRGFSCHVEGHELPVCVLGIELLLNSGPREPAAPRHIGNLTLLLLLLFPFLPDGAAIHQLLSRNLGSSLSSPKQSPNPILLSLASLSFIYLPKEAPHPQFGRRHLLHILRVSCTCLPPLYNISAVTFTCLC